MGIEALAHDPDVLAELGANVRAVNERHARVENIRKWRVLPGALTVAEGELTPTLKVKRNVVNERFGDLIREMYAEPFRRAAVRGHVTERSEDLYRAVGLGAPGYRRDDVARLAGIDRARSVKWWRAMGFPEVPEDVAAFSERRRRDREAPHRAVGCRSRRRRGDPPARAGSWARRSRASPTRSSLSSSSCSARCPAPRPGPRPPDRRSTCSPCSTTTPCSDLLEDSLVYVWRRHLMAALGRRLETDDSRRRGSRGLRRPVRLHQAQPARVRRAAERPGRRVRGHRLRRRVRPTAVAP